MFHFKIDLLKDNILKALLLFAFPILIANIFQQLYNTMDTMIVGNFLGDTSLAAISACGAVYELLIGLLQREIMDQMMRIRLRNQ